MNATDDLRGLGFFYASADMARDWRVSSARCAEARAAWAAILCESVDGRIQRRSTIRAHASALRGAGVRPILYTFPDPRACVAPLELKRAIDRACVAAQDAGIPHVCLDFEPFGGADWNMRQIQASVNQVHDAGLRASVTIFSRPRWTKMRWPTVPMVLQVYERARDPRMLERAIVAAETMGGLPVIPAIGTYLGDQARLANDLANVRAVTPASEGLAIWSLATTDASERAELARYAQGSV